MAFLFRKKRRKLVQVPSPVKQMDYRAVAATDTGSVREKNEDSLIFLRPHEPEKRTQRGCLALVADGMGGHSRGDIASGTATECIPRYFFDSSEDILPALKRGFELANKTIYQQAQKKVALKGMGTTCTAVVMRGNQLFLGHVGDSRAYLLKGDTLHQLSADHTYVQLLLERGLIKPEEVLSHPDRNIITRAMGTSAQLKADFSLVDKTFEVGNVLVLCSDGLYEYIPAEECKHIIETHSLNEAAQEMIHLAKKRGGHDNISVLLVEAREVEGPETIKETQNLNPS
ncbi:MAG: Stp1/IreP family PP2C-type Ser/Thr phosphatase [Bacteroidota bacterium]